MAVVVLLPFTGLIRIDPGNGLLLIAGRQVWLDEFFLVFGAAGVVLFAASAFFYPLGQSFCGWLCPQFTVSEFLGDMVRSLLGRRVTASLDPDRVAGRSKQKSGALVAAWGAFALAVIVFSVGATLTVLHYFYPLEVLWQKLMHPGRDALFVTFFAVPLSLFLLDFGFFRHFWCKYLCMFGVYQYLYRGRDTLQIRFEEARAGDCQRCTLCNDVCPMDLDPRQPEIYTRCINCGICIDACESYLGRFGRDKLLSFGFGTQRQELIRIGEGGSTVRAPKVIWPAIGVVLCLGLVVFGMIQFEPIKMMVHSEPTDYTVADGIGYTAVVINKGVTPATFDIALDGLPEGQAAMGRQRITLGMGERTTLPFKVTHAGLEHDRTYPFRFILTDTESGARYETKASYFMPAL